MKKVLISLFLLTLLVAPINNVWAKTMTAAERQSMLDQITALTQQLVNLQRLVAAMQSTEPRAAGAKLTIYPSRFYKGPYEALYFVENGQLIRRDNTTIRRGDQLLFATYVDMVGESFVRNHISEFRIFNDEENLLTGYVDQKNDASWILAVNRMGDDLTTEYDRDFNIELLLHETGHIEFFMRPYYQTNFTNQFWGSAVMKKHLNDLNRTENLNRKSAIAEKFYTKYSDNFVTDYAATSPVEDIVESFTSFILNDYPSGRSLADQKVRFFYDYPQLVKWRLSLREAAAVMNIIE